jgi:excisionase family DNA binding protein
VAGVHRASFCRRLSRERRGQSGSEGRVVTTTTPPAVYSLAEAAKLLGMSKSGLTGLASRGEAIGGVVPFLRLGRRVLVPRAPLDRLLGIEAS